MLENRALEIIIIAVIVLLLFGAKRLPDSARALGKSLRILKSEVGAMKDDGKKDAAVSNVQTSSEQQAEAAAPKTIQSAPGDVASARPVEDKQPTTQV
ncbi:Sec-independent protein translocase subunit TatA [Streptacidiphilus jiangxiensis]|uniref:Sec-independent protein translocase protein TatA n=1 Tax=Streptacidiphilus jiangxiensis TaxID=235985 RepID=A0A1H7ZB53_STRJI|nr:Sec-independent protein translocase subunit TatA [Streptacidiphilus jiangxiensis]SEM54719.1 sec-independent protein translocase protein TatA [Streptacidiphilus jiangxiensis]